MLLAAAAFVALASCIWKSAVVGKAAQAIGQLADAHARTSEVQREIAGLRSDLGLREWNSQLAQGTDRWLGAIDAILSSLPADVWLDNMATSDQGTGVSIEGNVDSFASLSALVDALRASGVFSDVRLSSAEASNANGVDCIRFSLVASTTPTGDDAETPDDPQQTGHVPVVEGAS